MEGGVTAMYFINGSDTGRVGIYVYCGGGIGFEGGLGIQIFTATHTKTVDTLSSFNAEGFAGAYNATSASTPLWSASKSWSNVKNTTDELYPGHRYPTT